VAVSSRRISQMYARDPLQLPAYGLGGLLRHDHQEAA
jgi:hypothetical protein